MKRLSYSEIARNDLVRLRQFIWHHLEERRSGNADAVTQSDTPP